MKIKDLIEEKEHEKICDCKNIVEVSKQGVDGIIRVKYGYCPKCGKYIKGKIISNNEYY